MEKREEEEKGSCCAWQRDRREEDNARMATKAMTTRVHGIEEGGRGGGSVGKGRGRRGKSESFEGRVQQNATTATQSWEREKGIIPPDTQMCRNSF